MVVGKKEFFGLVVLGSKASTHLPDSNRQPTALIRPLCCLSSDPFGRKVALKHTKSMAANYRIACAFYACSRPGCTSLMPVIQNMKTGNDLEKQSGHLRVHGACRIRPSHTLIHQHTANQNGHTGSTQPVRVSNGSDGQQPTFSDFASSFHHLLHLVRVEGEVVVLTPTTSPQRCVVC